MHWKFSMFFYMNLKRNYQNRAIYKKRKIYYVWLELQKLIPWLREIPSDIAFLCRFHIEKNDETFGKLLISKDASPAVPIGK